MKMHIVLYFSIISVILFVYVHGDEFNEELYIKPLLPAHVYTFFQFITLVKNDVSCKPKLNV